MRSSTDGDNRWPNVGVRERLRCRGLLLRAIFQPQVMEDRRGDGEFWEGADVLSPRQDKRGVKGTA